MVHSVDTHVWRVNAMFWMLEESEQEDADMDGLLDGMGNLDVDSVGGD